MPFAANPIKKICLIGFIYMQNSNKMVLFDRDGLILFDLDFQEYRTAL